MARVPSGSAARTGVDVVATRTSVATVVGADQVPDANVAAWMLATCSVGLEPVEVTNPATTVLVPTRLTAATPALRKETPVGRATPGTEVEAPHVPAALSDHS